MTLDFTQKIYKQLLQKLLHEGYTFQRMDHYFRDGNVNKKTIILRHDVDRMAGNALQTAQIEHSLGIVGSYYFRVVPESFQENIILGIKALGHEIGYHYEDVDLALNNKKLVMDANGELSRVKLIDAAFALFKSNLERFRPLAEVLTICMHGSPLSKFDNKIIWEKYSYKELGLIGEPYFDVDFSIFSYLTDTGRKWNATTESVRDRVQAGTPLNFRSTFEILANAQKLPAHIMITIHPERWNDFFPLWLKQIVAQNIKNVIKKALVQIRK